ncbi:hypothetical protein GCM10010302_16960 [Streptomyces polychromogenes]|uniref:Uncharacterized protein n=1 Tax=Streptomyces polychromogenes TaxID=67342 RepID=A0ABN0V7T7_9ACTN
MAACPDALRRPAQGAATACGGADPPRARGPRDRCDPGGWRGPETWLDGAGLTWDQQEWQDPGRVSDRPRRRPSGSSPTPEWLAPFRREQ